ncbi:MAG: hypothetical protein F6K30_13555 [Cyanothece sp. SIO2G6]|nr:hypothetical protein [Cyanothece sp. SIO2G6]
MNLSIWVVRLRTSLMLSLLILGGGGLASALMPRSPLWLTGSKAIAQATAPCLPPESDEYLVLVNQQTPTALDQLQTVLPEGSTTAICRYLNQVVTRVGGFATEEVATAWGRYLAETLDVQTAIVVPATPFAGADADTTSPAPSSPASTAASTAAPTYNPQRLGAGYAVLVDYADRPDVAIALQSTLGETVGVAVYRQVPYLLATYSAEAGTAAEVLTQLATAEFNAILVDSRQVILMNPAVELPGRATSGGIR